MLISNNRAFMYLKRCIKINVIFFSVLCEMAKRFVWLICASFGYKPIQCYISSNNNELQLNVCTESCT